MNSKKLFYLLIVFIVLLGCGIVGSAYFANTVLSQESQTLVGLKAKDKAVANQQVELIKDKKDIAKYDELNKIAKTVVPQDKDQAEAVREIVNLANQSGIPKLSSIAFPASTLGGIKTKTPGGLTQLIAVKGIPGVYNLEITITQSPSDLVSYGNFVSFLTKLEQNRRTAQVSSISVQPDSKQPNQVSFTLIINEFIKP